MTAGGGEEIVAVVLTLDAQLGLAELLHKRYSRLWPDNPLRFRIPHNGGARGQAMTYLMAQPDCAMVRCGREIRASLRALLHGIEETSWVFWCIDDRFPTWLDRGRLAAVHAGLADLPGSCEELKLLRWREPLTSKVHVVGGTLFTEQDQCRQWGFWHHHFVRAGVLRRVFLDPALADGAGIQDFVTNRLRGPGGSRGLPDAVEHRLFPGTALVPQVPLVRLAEPLIEGRLTRNGLEALKHEGCEVPPYDVVARDKEYVWAEP